MLGRVLIPLGAALCLAPMVSSGMALLLGVLLAISIGNPYLKQTQKITKQLLALSVVGLGAGMNLEVVGRVGLQGVGYTMIGITLTFILGLTLGRLFQTPTNTAWLITTGTAICGGSAIAAVSPIIKAKSQEISVALGVVFLLNALALFIFPPIGHAFHLSQTQFGLWSALAIHDTSSVLGASMQFGPRALEVGTTLKLTRALWIIPVSLLIGFYYSSKNKEGKAIKAKKPWFIFGFLVAAALVTWVPSLRVPGQIISDLAHRTLTVTLFLIGAGLTKEALQSVGIKALLQGICLWILVSTGSLLAILMGWIHS